MGQMEVNQIKDRILSEFRHLIDISDVQNHDQSQLENYLLTRSLTSYAIYLSAPSDTKENIVKFITDGSGDNGLDAVYYDNENKQLLLVQSKWNHKGDSEPDLGEIKKFTGGVRDLIELKFNKFNKKINDRSEEIKRILRKEKFKLKLILVYTAINLAKPAQQELSELLEELNDANDFAELEILNQSKLHHSLYHAPSADINLEVPLIQWGKYEEGKRAFYGQIPATQVAAWWNDHGNNLFSKNLRKLLGDTDINEEIKATIEAAPADFWYFNNGITMICHEVEKRAVHGNKREYGIFDCKRISIVNGAQTVGTIGKALKNNTALAENLENAYISFRIIELKDIDEDNNIFIDEKFAETITKCNNRQNKIEARDFIGLDSIQKRIERDLSIQGITYHVMRSAEVLIDDLNFDLKESTIALSCAKDIDAAITVYREPSKVWSDISHARYKKLFNPGVTSFFVYNCVRIYRNITEAISLLKDKKNTDYAAILSYGNELISCIVYQTIGSIKIEKNAINPTSFFHGYNLDDLVNNIADIIYTETQKSTKAIPNIFKSFTDCRILYETVLTTISGSTVIAPISIDSLIEEKFSNDVLTKTKIKNFDEKISGDSIAEGFFRHWMEQYDSKQHECGLVSNIHQYLKEGSENKSSRFMFRLQYYTTLIIRFNHNSYGTTYRSLLYDYPEFDAWLSSNGYTDGKIIIDDDKSLNAAKELLNLGNTLLLTQKNVKIRS
ncbi:AIPR family protein [Pelosinus sp. sgz500959]|uniref:AIPR family protein n=1 Tax=Pelosinus sp. sgz500959 TaxID=3242472 RepID=UPI003670BCCC